MYGKIAKDAMARLLLLACVVLFSTSNAAAQDSIEKSFLLKQIGPNVWAALPNPNAKVPTVVNAGFVIGDDGVAVVDTLFTFDAKGNPGNESNTELLSEGKSGTSLVEAVMPALTGKYSQWDYFKYLVGANILDTEAELNGKKTPPQAQLGK